MQSPFCPTPSRPSMNRPCVHSSLTPLITAASPGGPRYNPNLTSEKRRSADNAIWLSQNCAKLIDNDPLRYTEAELRRWKAEAEEVARAEVGKPAGPSKKSPHPSSPPRVRSPSADLFKECVGQSPFPPCRDAWGPSLKPTFLRNLELRKLPGREAKSRGPSKPELVSLKMSCN